MLHDDWSIRLVENRPKTLGSYAQHALIRPLEACRKCLHSKGIMGMILLHLSKANDWLPSDLTLGKLTTYDKTLPLDVATCSKVEMEMF